MTKTVTFYGCILVFALLCSVSGSLLVSLSLMLLWVGLLIQVRSDLKKSSHDEIMQFTGAQWFKNKFGIDLLDEED